MLLAGHAAGCPILVRLTVWHGLRIAPPSWCMLVFLHTRPAIADDWLESIEEMDALPVVGGTIKPYRNEPAYFVTIVERRDGDRVGAVVWAVEQRADTSALREASASP